MGKNAALQGVLLLWLLSVPAAAPFSCCGDGSPSGGCRERERKALLNLRQLVLEDPSNRLSSWTGDDCCAWKGVECDNRTGHVLQLDLRNPIDDPDAADYERSQLMFGSVNSSSLLELKHLEYLDLSSNDFGHAHVPGGFFHSLANLKYLNLSHAGFAGLLPPQLRNLSSLQYLDVGGYENDLNGGNLEWVARLPALEFLDMSWVNLSQASDWLQVMTMLPSLSELYLSHCELVHALRTSISYANLSSLLSLDLSSNYRLNSSVFDWLPTLPSLVSLNLSGSNFQDASPVSVSSALGNLTSLTRLRLARSGLGGGIPSSLGNLCRLKDLDLSHNQLTGGVSEFLGNSSPCFEGKLEYLDLSWNGLTGQLPSQALRGFGNLSFFDISSNAFSGPIPESLGSLSKLQALYMSNNSLDGIVTELHFANLTSLMSFFASSNPLILQVSSDWVPPFRKLNGISMRSWRLGPRFPAWLLGLKNLTFIDFSNAGISDVIPTWFWGLSQIEYLYLQHNQIHGSIPIISFGKYILLGSNNFSGSLPRISSETLQRLDLSNNSFHGTLSPIFGRKSSINNKENNMEVLNLSNNLLSGELPKHCWMNWKNLVKLRLGRNSLTGNIPTSMGSLRWLGSLSLRKNKLSGNLPQSLQNCTSLQLLDLGENEFSGSIPPWVGKSLSILRILALRSNKLNGSIPLELCRLNFLQILDLARNNLSGTIPQCFHNFSAMTNNVSPKRGLGFHYQRDEIGINLPEELTLVTKEMEYEYKGTLLVVKSMDLSSNNLFGGIPEVVTNLNGLQSLNLSNNHLGGEIPKKIGSMNSLESIDLSLNQLLGEIPRSMSNLSFLSYLNLSCNHLSGMIPLSTQIQSFTWRSFTGNNGLCGLPLAENCTKNDAVDHQLPTTPSGGGTGEDDNHGWIDMQWFYISLPVGFVVGFWAILAPLAFIKTWRYAYFRFLDDIKFKLFGF
ncbi:receptor-like protein EIX2 [Malania oleifera]|uniref:receptor-like protein EIX2 n=1 Tax=Malania oleifera TaxID=397392 RepID=UPI0025AEBE88|nr:receptor-like protein EIX2 [Malania oleifera]